MSWSYLKLSQLEELKNLILLREHCCLKFSAIFMEKYFNILKNNFVNYENNAETGIVNKTCLNDLQSDLQNALQNSSNSKDSVKAHDIIVHNSWPNNALDFSIMLSENGQLLPVCRKNITIKIIDFNKGLEIFGSTLSKVNTIMGDKKSVNNILKTCFSRKVVSEGINSFDYYTMTLDENSFIPCTLYPREINIRLAAQGDIENLMPLQRNYEIEEVLPNPKMFNEAATKKHLAMILKNQITAVAEKSGKIIAKANTNEKGFSYHQIGGVYTLPEYRNMGISTALVSYLIENIFSKGMKASLFVKKNNPAAIKVYIKLGFSKIEDFQITYFLYQ